MPAVQHPFRPLPAEVSIYTVAELRNQWLAELPAEGADDAGADVEIDASAVEQFDAAGAQGLLSLALTLAVRGQRLRLVPASVSVVAACGVLGLLDLVTPLAAGAAA